MPSVQGRHDKGPSMIIITSVMTAVALLLVVARIMSRRLSIRKLAIDDYLVTLSIVSTPSPHPKHPFPLPLPMIQIPGRWQSLTKSPLAPQPHIRRPLRRSNPPRRRPARHRARTRRGLQGHLLHPRRLRAGPSLHHGPQVCRHDPPGQDTQHRQGAPANNVGCLGRVLPYHAWHGYYQLCAVQPGGDTVGGFKGEVLAEGHYYGVCILERQYVFLPLL